MILPSSTVSPRTMSATCCQEDRYRQEKNRKGKSTITLRSSGLSYQSLGADLDLLLNYTSYFLNSEATPKGVASWILTYKILCVSHDRLTLERVQNLRKSGIRTPSADKMPSAALPLCYPSILPLSGLCFVLSAPRLTALVEAGDGLEPSTFRIWDWRAANCSTPPCKRKRPYLLWANRMASYPRFYTTLSCPPVVCSGTAILTAVPFWGGSRSRTCVIPGCNRLPDLSTIPPLWLQS